MNIKTPELLYPYSDDMLRRDNPQTSFPDQITDALRSEYGVEPVTIVDPPAGDVVTEIDPALIDGVWTQQWSVREFTPEELQTRRESMAVSQRRARRALLQLGLLSQVETAINALPEPEKSAALIEWEYAQEIRRGNALVQSLAPALNLSEEDLDNLFAAASQIPE